MKALASLAEMCRFDSLSETVFKKIQFFVSEECSTFLRLEFFIGFVHPLPGGEGHVILPTKWRHCLRQPTSAERGLATIVSRYRRKAVKCVTIFLYFDWTNETSVIFRIWWTVTEASLRRRPLSLSNDSVQNTAERIVAITSTTKNNHKEEKALSAITTSHHTHFCFHSSTPLISLKSHHSFVHPLNINTTMYVLDLEIEIDVFLLDT
jgi:hypothetical protein